MLDNESWIPKTSRRQEEIVLSDTADLAEPIFAIAIFVAGQVRWIDLHGNEHTKTFPVGVWQFAMKKIFDTGTNVAVSDMLGCVS